MKFCRFILFSSLWISLPGFSAQLTLSIQDADKNPIKDAVAALISTTPVDFSTVPPAEMDQRDKMFVPKVLAIRVNTLVRFPNSDDIRHHVYSFSPAKKFELRLYHGSTAEPVLFDKAGTVVLGCNIHDSMVAYIYVLETNYFAVSDPQGNLHINAPEGSYQLQIQHPYLNDVHVEENLILNGEVEHKKTITLDKLLPPASAEPDDEFSSLF